MTRKWPEETLKTLDQLCLFDDDFMSKVFTDNIDTTEFVIRTILEHDDIEIISQVVQHEIMSPVFGGRMIVTDIQAKDSTGKEYNIEVQRASSGAIPQRARLHSAMIDATMLRENEKFTELKDSYIIFITQNDVLGMNYPLYHIEREIIECEAVFGDGSHIIYVNGAYKDDNTAIGRLIHDFGCVRAADMYCEDLKRPVSYFKETEGGRDNMCEIIEKYAEKRAAEVAAEAAKSTRQSAIKMIKGNKLTFEEIADYVSLPLDEIEALAAEVLQTV